MKNCRVFLIFAGIFLLAVGSLFAQNTELRFGQAVSGNLRGAEIWYSIRANEDGLAIIETTSDMDTYLEAFDSNNNLIIENDDGGESLNARLEFFVRRGATYRIKLRGYGSGTTGPFSILATINPIPSITSLNFGSVQSGNIAEGQSYWYSIRATQSGLVTIETISGIDTYLEVYSSEYVLLHSDDDSGDESNARIEFMAEANKTFIIRVRGYNSSETGPYRIVAAFSSITPTSINFGSVQSGNITGGQSYWYSVRSTQDGVITIETISDIDTYLEVYSNDFVLLHSDDDSGDGSNARIEFMAEPNKTFIIKVRGYSSSAVGPYRVIASFTQIPADERNTERARAALLRLNEAIPVFFRAQNESRWYRYSITANNTVLIVRTRGNTDTYLTLYDSNGNVLAEDDDSGDDTNAYIRERLSSGVYFIEVKDLFGRVGHTILSAETN